jgi:hypothetical protein
VVFRIPTLKFLDSSPVTEWERNEAKRVGHLTGIVVRPKEEAYKQTPEPDPEAENIKALPAELRSLGKTGGASFTKTKYVRATRLLHACDVHHLQLTLVYCRCMWDGNRRATGLSSTRTCKHNKERYLAPYHFDDVLPRSFVRLTSSAFPRSGPKALSHGLLVDTWLGIEGRIPTFSSTLTNATHSVMSV